MLGAVWRWALLLMCAGALLTLIGRRLAVMGVA
jgi:hypothetical protein